MSINNNNTTVTHDEIRAISTRHLYKAGTPGIIANFFVVMVLAWVIWGKMRNDYIVIWVIINNLVNLMRYLFMSHVIKKGYIDGSNWKRWAYIHAVLAGCISTTWGFAIVYFIPGHSEMLVFFILATAGLTAGAMSIVAIYYPSYLAYSIPLVLALSWRLFITESELNIQMAVLALLYAGTILITARNYTQNFYNSTKLRLQLEKDAYIDALTGIANRRSFDERFYMEWHRMMRKKSELTLLVIDIDYFKIYNDHLGHQEGDICLERVAKEIHGSFRRASDFVARLGGEEFAVIIPETPSEFVPQLAENVRSSIENLNIKHPGKKIKCVTVSIGTATVTPSIGVKRASLYTSADKALYRAKHSGRNRVIIA